MKKILLTIILAVFLLPNFARADITSSLTAWWKWDEGSGTSASDSTGNGHTGTLNGTASWSSGSKIGPFASIYTGVTGNGTSISSITTGTTWTFVTWFWVDSGAQSTYVNFIGQSATIDIGVKTSVNHMSFFYSSDHLGTATIGRDGWHHMVIVNNAGAITFYYDGASDGTFTSGPTFNANGMGCDGGTSGECLKGRLDDTRLYSRALSSADVTELFNFSGVTGSIRRFFFGAIMRFKGIIKFN
jgi:hypothetical protein